jgi:hypothetical protein
MAVPPPVQPESETKGSPQGPAAEETAPVAEPHVDVALEAESALTLEAAQPAIPETAQPAISETAPVVTPSVEPPPSEAEDHDRNEFFVL